MIWWAAVLTAFVLGLLWTAVHEGAHALAALARRRKVLSFKPWPHKVDGKFYFGRLTYEGRGTPDIHVAPYVLDAVVFAGAAILVFLLEQEVARSILFGVLFPPLVNTGAAVQARYRGVAQPDLSKVHWWAALVFFYLEAVYLGVALWVIAKGVYHG